MKDRGDYYSNEREDYYVDKELLLDALNELKDLVNYKFRDNEKMGDADYIEYVDDKIQDVVRMIIVGLEGRFK